VSDASAREARRATSLLRWYPPAWRARYGDEFLEVLLSDLAERPRSWRRAANVARSGLLARLSSAGLGGRVLEPFDQMRASLVSLGCAAAVFLVFGTAIWSQLTIGWQWSEPDATGTRAAMVVMTGAMVLLSSLVLLAALPVAWTVLTRCARRQGHRLVWPSALFLSGGALLVVGSRHFANGWPGTGGHPWAHQGLVPGGVSAFAWASTLSISSYWAHPGALRSFPATEVAWMAVSPIAMTCLVVGAAKVVRRLDLSPGVLRYEARLSGAATLGMLAFLGGCGSWVVDGGPGPRNLFHSGDIDVAGLVMMTVALTIARRANGRARRGGRALRPT
jgi:hypothetical protein